jgi:hypothetical protein
VELRVSAANSLSGSPLKLQDKKRSATKKLKKL